MRAAAAALVLLAGALLGLPADRAQAQTAQSVAVDWPLIPSGLGPGDSFRLLFITSTGRNAQSSNIADYNSFVQGRANAGHSAIRGFSGQFRALISTSAVNARTNTFTRSTDTDAPIYWLNGAKVADDYADLYDGGWDSNIPRNQAGNTVTGSPAAWTGTSSTGTTSNPAGGINARYGVPKTQGFELAGNSANAGLTWRLYGLSPVITVSHTPAKVTGVTVDQVTHDSIRVRWTKPAESSARPITSFGINTRGRQGRRLRLDCRPARHRCERLDLPGQPRGERHLAHRKDSVVPWRRASFLRRARREMTELVVSIPAAASGFSG